MSLIFHAFASRQDAEAFTAAVRLIDSRFQTAVYASAYEARAHDPFPFELHPPIVHVWPRGTNHVEGMVERLVESYGGKFAGT